VKKKHTGEEHMAAGSLLALGKMLHEWGYPLDKALRGLKIAYEIAALPEPCTCRAERDRELCQRKDRCAAVNAFVEQHGGDSPR
jgi:hypothetical protein